MELQHNGDSLGNKVSWLSDSERDAREKGRETDANGLLLFPVSRLRIPKIPDFC